MKKFQAIIHFEMDDEFMSFIPPHRTYINYLINKNIIDSYAVSMESQTVWVTINAKTKADADEYLSKSPLNKYWTYKIEELFVYDSQLYRLPAVQLN
ncbi:MAG TPA: hypothetical protein VN958_19235 [Chitinophagaceae bacterium]|nr:hypothetical protein [Chitinophagaceae bacterium]